MVCFGEQTVFVDILRFHRSPYGPRGIISPHEGCLFVLIRSSIISLCASLGREPHIHYSSQLLTLENFRPPQLSSMDGSKISYLSSKALELLQSIMVSFIATSLPSLPQHQLCRHTRKDCARSAICRVLTCR